MWGDNWTCVCGLAMLPLHVGLFQWSHTQCAFSYHVIAVPSCRYVPYIIVMQYIHYFLLSFNVTKSYHSNNKRNHNVPVVLPFCLASQILATVKHRYSIHAGDKFPTSEVLPDRALISAETCKYLNFFWTTHEYLNLFLFHDYVKNAVCDVQVTFWWCQ